MFLKCVLKKLIFRLVFTFSFLFLFLLGCLLKLTIIEQEIYTKNKCRKKRPNSIKNVYQMEVKTICFSMEVKIYKHINI